MPTFRSAIVWFRSAIVWFCCWFYHISLFVVLVTQPMDLMNSDTILQQKVTTDGIVGASNETTTTVVQVGFQAFRSFDDDGHQYRSIHYSSEQKELFDKAFFMAEKMGAVAQMLSTVGWWRIPFGLGIVLLSLPCLFFSLGTVVVLLSVSFLTNKRNIMVLHKCFLFICSVECWNVVVTMVALVAVCLAALAPLLLILANLLALTALPTLSMSNLCGPDYMELQYNNSNNINNNTDGDYYGGTVAIIHEGTEASCHISNGGATAFILICGAYFLLCAEALLFILFHEQQLLKTQHHQHGGGPAAPNQTIGNTTTEPGNKDDNNEIWAKVVESVQSSKATTASSFIVDDDLEDFPFIVSDQEQRHPLEQSNTTK